MWALDSCHPHSCLGSFLHLRTSLGNAADREADRQGGRKMHLQHHMSWEDKCKNIKISGLEARSQGPHRWPSTLAVMLLVSEKVEAWTAADLEED